MNNASLVLLILCLGQIGSVYAQESTVPVDAKERMAEMAELAAAVTMDVVIDRKPQSAKQHPAALLRTIETGRLSNISKEDGSLWLWSYDGLPVAMMELWAQNDSHDWGHTLLAVSAEKIQGTAGGERWRPKLDSGVKFKRLLKAGKPKTKAPLRKVQMRQISRRFTTNIDDPGQENTQQFRLLTEPIHRYQGGDVEDGAIFAFVRGESNSEVLLFVQARNDQWEYGFLRCSSNTLMAQLDGNEVWVAPQVPGWVGSSSEPFWVVRRQSPQRRPATNLN